MVSFLKMDVERAEYEALKDFTLWARIRDFSIELHDHADWPRTREGWKDKIFEFEDWLRAKPIQGKLWAPERHLYDM